MSTAYTPVAKGLHWLMAVLILGMSAPKRFRHSPA